MIRVNLLTAGAPAKGSAKAVRNRPTIVAAAVLVCTVAALGGWWWMLNRRMAALNVNIAQAERDLTRLKAVALLVDRATTRRAELSQKLELIDRLRRAQRGPVTLLSTVSQNLPDGLWLLELNQKDDTVQIEGRATSVTAVTDFVERLQGSGLFDRPVEIVTTGMELVDDSSVVRFAVKAQALGSTAAAAAAAAPPAAKKGD
jgi:Tfp pilus assembly protein PilN